MDHRRSLELLRHCEWADAAIWRAVLALEEPDERIVGWMHHVHLVQHAYLSVWSGAPLDLENLPRPEDHPDLRSMVEWGRERHQGLREDLSTKDDADLDRTLVFPWAKSIEEEWDRPLEPVTLVQSMLQVVQHSTHHRAQVAIRLRELGGEPPPLDYIRWLWRGCPAPEWP